MMNWLLLKNSLFVTSLATLLAVLFGFLAALFVAGLGVRARKLALAIALVALALPPFVVTNAWLHFLGNAGVWHSWLPLNIFSLGGTAWILSLLTWPITMITASAAWSRLEPSQLESDSAVTGGRLIRWLLLPLGRAALAQAAVLTFVLALNNFSVPTILQVKAFPAETWVLFNTSFDSVGALRLGWPLVVAPLILLFWFGRREIPWPRLERSVSPLLFRQRLGGAWFWFAGACTIGISLLSVGLPLWQLASTRRTWTELPGALAAGQSAVAHTLGFAISSSTIIICLAIAVGNQSWFGRCFHFNERPANSSHLASAFGALIWLPFLVPGVLLGIAFIALFNHPWSSLFYQSVGIVVLAFVLRYLGWGWTGVTQALRSADPDLTDAARSEGATRWQIFRLVVWPQIAPRVTAAWYVVFLLCLWDVESMILVVPPGGETLALRVFNLLHYGHNDQVNALCLVLLAVALAPLMLWKLLQLTRARLPAWPRAAYLALFAVFPAFDGCSPSTLPASTQLSSQLFDAAQIIGSRGVGVGQLNKPRSVAVDLRDNLFVVDMTGRVQKFSPAGSFMLEWQMPQTDLGKPKGMCRDQEGNIVVLEPHYQRVNYFSTEGKLVAQWGVKGTNAGQFNLPRSVAVNSHGEISVSEYGIIERVQRFRVERGTSDPSSQPAVQLLNGFGHMGAGPGEFNRPEGLCVDAQDRLYVADSCNHRIQVFSREGKFLRAYGKAGSGKGELSYPYDICVDPAGRQYVCEFGNSRIQVFDAADQPLEIIGGPGARPGEFSNPWGVALDSAGNLYVADSQNHRVQKLLRRQTVAKN